MAEQYNLGLAEDEIKRRLTEVGSIVDESKTFVPTTTKSSANGYYNNYGKVTTHNAAWLYEPIDVSAYIGKKVKVVVKWTTYTSTSWCNTLMFRPDNNVNTATQVSGLIRESDAYAQRVGDTATLEVDVTDNYLLISARDASTTISISVDYVEEGRVSKIEDELSMCYVSPDGDDDDNDGTESSPYKTLSKALLTCSNVIMKNGYYEDERSIYLRKCKSKSISIKVENGGRAVIFAGKKLLTTDGSLVDGYTKVYSATIQGGTDSMFNRHWIYQWGVADEKTLIPNDERTAYHRRRTHRCDVTAMMKVSSIAEIESYDGYAWYYSNGTLYYSRPEAVSAENYLWLANNNFFENYSGMSIEMRGVYVFGKSLNIHDTIDSTFVDCGAIGCYGSYAWSLDRSVNLTLNRCEAAHAETGGTAATGDGFNVHVGNDVDLIKDYCSFSLIDCWSHDNYNDGYSDHEGCYGYIIGGLYEHNCIGGAGAGLTPAYGAHDVIEHAICQNNNGRGLMYVGDGTQAGSETGDYGTVYVNGVISRNNARTGFEMPNITNGSKAIGDFANCIAYSNKNGFVGNNSTMRCINCKSINNTDAQYTNVTNIGSI